MAKCKTGQSGHVTGQSPALHGTTISKTFAKQISALHQSRQSFIKTESSERIGWALHHQICFKYRIHEIGDSAYYKREREEKWWGLGKVIGQGGKAILVHHGNVYGRVSAYGLIKIEGQCNSFNSKNYVEQISENSNKK